MARFYGIQNMTDCGKVKLSKFLCLSFTCLYCSFDTPMVECDS